MEVFVAPGGDECGGEGVVSQRSAVTLTEKESRGNQQGPLESFERTPLGRVEQFSHFYINY